MTSTTAKFIVSQVGEIPQWQAATWEDYVAACEDPSLEEARIFFYEGYLWIDMGNEGPQHARFNNLLTLVFFDFGLPAKEDKLSMIWVDV
jgi:hypothetical protein